MDFTFTLPTAEIERAIEGLGDRALPAISRALNRAAVSTRVVLARNIAKDMGLKVGTVRDQISISEARPVTDRLRARLMVSGARIPLIDFNAKASKRGGVTAKLPAPGKGRYPSAFIARTRSGHLGVFMRKGKARLPIRQLYGPSLPLVFNRYAPEALVRGEESFLKNLASELRFAQSQAG